MPAGMAFVLVFLTNTPKMKVSIIIAICLSLFTASVAVFGTGAKAGSVHVVSSKQKNGNPCGRRSRIADSMIACGIRYVEVWRQRSAIIRIARTDRPDLKVEIDGRKPLGNLTGAGRSHVAWMQTRRVQA